MLCGGFKSDTSWPTMAVGPTRQQLQRPLEPNGRAPATGPGQPLQGPSCVAPNETSDTTLNAPPWLRLVTTNLLCTLGECTHCACFAWPADTLACVCVCFSLCLALSLSGSFFVFLNLSFYCVFIWLDCCLPTPYSTLSLPRCLSNISRTRLFPSPKQDALRTPREKKKASFNSKDRLVGCQPKLGPLFLVPCSRSCPVYLL